MKQLRKNIVEQAVAVCMATLGSAWKRGLRANVPFATYNYKGGVLNGTATGPTYSEGLMSIAEVKLDFAAIAAARVAASQAALAAADVMNVMGIPAGIYVPMVGLQVSTVEGAAATVDVGDVTTPNGFLDDTNLNALGRTGSLVTTAYSVAVGGGKWFNADGTIDMLLNNNAIDVALTSLFVTLVDLRKTR